MTDCIEITISVVARRVYDATLELCVRLHLKLHQASNLVPRVLQSNATSPRRKSPRDEFGSNG